MSISCPHFFSQSWGSVSWLPGDFPHCSWSPRREMKRGRAGREGEMIQETSATQWDDLLRLPGPKAPGCPFSLLWPRSAASSLPQTLRVERVCFPLTLTHTHSTHPCAHPSFRALGNRAYASFSSSATSSSVCTRSKSAPHTHTHTHKVHGTFCVAPVLSLSGSPVSAAGGYSPPPLLSLVQWHSVGAGRDGFVQLQVQGSRAELQAAVAGLTDAAGLEQLLAWHWDLLVTAAGTEHVTAVPAGRNTKVTAGLSDRASLHLMLPCVSSLHLHQGLFFRHEQLCELDRIVIHSIKVWISNLFNADQELGYNLQKWKLPELIWMIF